MDNGIQSEHRKKLANDLLHQIAEALSQGAKSFAETNQRLVTIGNVNPVTNPTPRFEVSTKTWIDFESGKGVNVNVGPGDDERGLRILLNDIGESRWFSFSYDLNLEAAKTARYVGIRLHAKSYGMAALRPCLRYISDTGFEDTFASQQFIWRGGDDEQLCFIRVDQEMIGRAHAVEVMFFFSGQKFDITLLDVENLHI